jgi:prepilin-type N-terminal cleavage/methylation domain-containing protein
MKLNKKGFTLVELLIVVAIIGIIAAIAIPNLLDAMNRSRHKRSSADIRSIGTGVESYKVDSFGNCPAQALGDVTPTVGILNALNYMTQAPTLDGWASNIQYVTGTSTSISDWTDAAAWPANAYRMQSYGSDGPAGANVAALNDDTTALGSDANNQGRESRNWGCDIVYGDGQFIFGGCV